MPETTTSQSPVPLLLFCRLPGDPYVSCGRLGLREFAAEERPMRFVFELLDAAALEASSWFQAIVLK